MTNDKVLLGGKVMDEKLDPELERKLNDGEVVVPTKWYYDASKNQLSILFQEGVKNCVVTTRAILDESKGRFRMATLENSMEVLLLKRNRVGALS